MYDEAVMRHQLLMSDELDQETRLSLIADLSEMQRPADDNAIWIGRVQDIVGDARGALYAMLIQYIYGQDDELQ